MWAREMQLCFYNCDSIQLRPDWYIELWQPTHQSRAPIHENTYSYMYHFVAHEFPMGDQLSNNTDLLIVAD